MSSDTPQPPYDDKEARLTALLLGELSPEEAAALMQEMEKNVGLAQLHERLKHAIGLVREVSNSSDSPGPLQLSAERRAKLQQMFQAVPVQKIPAPRRPRVPMRDILALAAVLMVLGALSALVVLPQLNMARSPADRTRYVKYYKGAPSHEVSVAYADESAGEKKQFVGNEDWQFRSEATPLPKAEIDVATESESLGAAPAKRSRAGRATWGSQPNDSRFGGRSLQKLNERVGDRQIAPKAINEFEVESKTRAVFSPEGKSASGRVELGDHFQVELSDGISFRGGAAPTTPPPAPLQRWMAEKDGDAAIMNGRDSVRRPVEPSVTAGLDVLAPQFTPPPAPAGPASGPAKPDPSENQIKLGGVFKKTPADEFDSRQKAQDGLRDVTQSVDTPTGGQGGAMAGGINDPMARRGMVVLPSLPPTTAGTSLGNVTSGREFFDFSVNGVAELSGKELSQLPETRVTDKVSLADDLKSSETIAAYKVDALPAEPVTRLPRMSEEETMLHLYSQGIVQNQPPATFAPETPPTSTTAGVEAGKDINRADRAWYFRSEGGVVPGSSPMAAEEGRGPNLDSFGVSVTDRERVVPSRSRSKGSKVTGTLVVPGTQPGQVAKEDQARGAHSKGAVLGGRPRQSDLTASLPDLAKAPSSLGVTDTRAETEYRELLRRTVPTRRLRSEIALPQVELAQGSERKDLVSAPAVQPPRASKPAPVVAKPDGAVPEQLIEEQLARRNAPAAPVPQPEVETRNNAFSTFSLNVSDVSFKLATASLEAGAMPDPATIRSEEFINAFDYRDSEPPPGMPIAFAWERARFPFAHNRDVVRLSVKTAAAGRQPGRPLNLVLVVDNSGSMERADRVTIMQECLRVLATQLQPEDRISVVAFARTARLWVDGLPGNQGGELAEKVGQLIPQGGTNLEDALKLGYETALRHYHAQGINRVVMLTDGAANLGDVDPSSLKRKVEEHRKQGIALDCFGIGWEGYNDDLLEALSRNGDGRYGFVNTLEAASSEFAGQLAGALRVAASDVKVQVEFNPRRCITYRQIGYAKHQLTKEQFRDNTVDAAEIGAAESGNALYVVQANPQGEGPLAFVRVRYKTPGTADYHEHEWVVPFNGGAVEMEEATPAMRLATVASSFSEWLAQSPFAGEITPDRLLGYLSGVSQVYGADPRPAKLEWAIRHAKGIAGK